VKRRYKKEKQNQQNQFNLTFLSRAESHSVITHFGSFF